MAFQKLYGREKPAFMLAISYTGNTGMVRCGGSRSFTQEAAGLGSLIGEGFQGDKVVSAVP